jgi:hypothetical protein
MGIEVQVWDESRLMGWKNSDPPEIGEGGLTFETLFGPAVRAGEHFDLWTRTGRPSSIDCRSTPSWTSFGASGHMPGSPSTSEHTID